MTISLAGFDLGSIDTNILLTEASKASAFQRAGRRINLSPTGSVVKSVADIQSFGVGEGAAKTASGTGSKVVVGSNKFAVVVVETLEAWGYDSAVADAVFDYAPTAHAKTYDNIVAGMTPVPADFTNFSTLSGAATVEIGTGTAAAENIDDAVAGIANGNASAFVLSTTMLAYLKRQRFASGTRVFETDGDNSEGTIDGIPYYTFTSGMQVGYVGDFENRFLYGTADIVTPSFFVKDAGNITDNEGVEHNLTDSNKLALFHEILQGSGVAGIENFRKIVPAV